jgi:hypothetical protein
MAPAGPESLAVASLRNPEDAVNLLVLASEAVQQIHDVSDGESTDEGKETPQPNEECGLTFEAASPQNKIRMPALKQLDPAMRAHNHHNHNTAQKPPFKPEPNLTTFPLVVQGILAALKVWHLITKMHFIFPMVPQQRLHVPHTEDSDALARFAEEEKDLASTIVVIASRYMND